MKITNVKETVMVKNFVGEYVQKEGKLIEVEELKFFLLHNKFYSIVESQTGVSVTIRQKTKSGALRDLELLTSNMTKLREAIVKTIKKHGYAPSHATV